jgi:hypothetical protein
MRKISILLILLLITITSNCKKDSLPHDLRGKWVRVDNSTQIITFGYQVYDDWFTYLKGYKIDNDGNQRPIEFLGEYSFNNNKDSISIHWMHSSLSIWPTYYFSHIGSKIEIGDLINGSDSIFVFEKVK